MNSELIVDCQICQSRNHLDDATIVYQDKYWLVRHSRETNILGYLVLEAKRHYLDLSEASAEERKCYGDVLSALMKAMRKATGCQRIYTFSLGEAVPHYHLHMIPRTEALPEAYRGRGIMSYPLQPVAEPAKIAQVCEDIRRALSEY